MTYSTSIVNGCRVNTFEYRDAEGRLMREETDTLGSQGQLIEKKVYNYNEKGKPLSSRVMCLEENGALKNDEAFWTYNSDGSEIMDNRIVFTNPDKTQEFRFVQFLTGAGGNTVARGEGRDANGQKLYDITMTYDENENEKINTVKYSYPDGTATTEHDRQQKDGTSIREVFDENAAGQIVKQTIYQQNPNGSYDRTSFSTTYRDNGKKFVSQSEESVDADGNRKTEYVSYNIDENGFGSGQGVMTEVDGRRAIVSIEFRNDEDEGKVCATTYKYSDGTIDLRYEVTAPDGTKTSTYEQNIQNYDGDENESVEMDPELNALIGQDAEDPFDAWNMVFGDWNVEESHYIGDPRWLESDIEYNYYDTDIDWGDESDWGGVSDWGYDGGNYGDFGGWDYAFDW